MLIGEKWKITKDEITPMLDNDLIKTDWLTEDMFQAVYENVVIDSGWYEDAFISFLIINHDWDNPLMRVYSFNLKDVLIAIKSIEYYYKESSLSNLK